VEAAARDVFVASGSASEPEMAVECLARLRPAGAVGAFFESLAKAPAPAPGQAEARRRRQVGLVVALGRTEVDQVCPSALSPSPEARLVALRALGLLATERSTQCFLDAAAHADPGVRAAAAANLGALAAGRRMGASDLYGVATRLSGDSDPGVRAAAAASFTLFAERNARKRLVPLAQDPDPAVREAAVRSLERLED
jgi:HEAT repeat protein